MVRFECRNERSDEFRDWQVTGAVLSGRRSPHKTTHGIAKFPSPKMQSKITAFTKRLEDLPQNDVSTSEESTPKRKCTYAGSFVNTKPKRKVGRPPKQAPIVVELDIGDSDVSISNRVNDVAANDLSDSNNAEQEEAVQEGNTANAIEKGKYLTWHDGLRLLLKSECHIWANDGSHMGYNSCNKVVETLQKMIPYLKEGTIRNKYTLEMNGKDDGNVKTLTKRPKLEVSY